MRYEFRTIAFTLRYFKLSEFFGRTAQERSATRRSTLIGVVIAAPLCFGFDQISRHFGLSERLSALGMFFLGLLSLCGAAFVAGALWPDLMKEAEEDFEKRTAKRNLAENAEQRAVDLQAARSDERGLDEDDLALATLSVVESGRTHDREAQCRRGRKIRRDLENAEGAEDAQRTQGKM
jgi:hypothetical protein